MEDSTSARLGTVILHREIGLHVSVRVSSRSRERVMGERDTARAGRRWRRWVRTPTRTHGSRRPAEYHAWAYLEGGVVSLVAGLRNEELDLGVRHAEVTTHISIDSPWPCRGNA